jgi:hypothetical protein
MEQLDIIELDLYVLNQSIYKITLIDSNVQPFGITGFFLPFP